MTEQMTRRPWRVSGAAAPGRVGVPTVLVADADADACAQVRDPLLEGTGPRDLRTVAGARELDECLGGGGPWPELIAVDIALLPE
jgi:hypothetical protein